MKSGATIPKRIPVTTTGGKLKRVFVVVDHVCEADIVCAVFSTKSKAEAWIKAEEKKPQTPHWFSRFDSVEIMEFDLG